MHSERAYRNQLNIRVGGCAQSSVHMHASVGKCATAHSVLEDVLLKGIEVAVYTETYRNFHFPCIFWIQRSRDQYRNVTDAATLVERSCPGE